MKVVSLSIERCRSITRAYRLPVGQWTVLIGPNNEAKPNILRDVATVMTTLANQHYAVVRAGAKARLPAPPSSRRHVGHTPYEWSSDYPVSLQAGEPDGESVFTVEFELSEDEVQEFRSEVGSRLNGTLLIQVSIGSQGAAFLRAALLRHAFDGLAA